MFWKPYNFCRLLNNIYVLLGINLYFSNKCWQLYKKWFLFMLATKGYVCTTITITMCQSLSLYHIQYTRKHQWQKFFVVFHWTAKLFPRIMALLISNISLQNCYSEGFTTNSYFPLKTQKFFPVDVFSYIVYALLSLTLWLTLTYH